MAAFQTMNAIKRKMHKLKTDKENEYDRVDQLEQKFIELRTLNEKVNSSTFFLQFPDFEKGREQICYLHV